ncbi:hypothetical protein Bca4012_020710 [Brassica carinata]
MDFPKASKALEARSLVSFMSEALVISLRNKLTHSGPSKFKTSSFPVILLLLLLQLLLLPRLEMI